MKVTKEVTFDAAHMLSNYIGKCHNLHGHTYKLQVTLEGSLNEEGNEQDMVMDFNTIKGYLEVVKNLFDHAIIFSDEEHRSSAEAELFDWAEKYEMNFVTVEGKSTSENIASHIKGILDNLLDMMHYTVSVKLWETPTSFAEV